VLPTGICNYRALTAPSEHTGRAVADCFRFENGKIVEHWDTIQDVGKIRQQRTECSEGIAWKHPGSIWKSVLIAHTSRALSRLVESCRIDRMGG
jgi:hypothetical protein